MTELARRPQSPQRFFLNAPKQKDGECYVLNFDYMELDAYCVSLLREIDRLKYDLKVQNAVVDLAYIPHRNLVDSRDHVIAERDRLRAALEQIRDYHVIQGMTPALFAEKVLRPSDSIGESHAGD